MGKRYRWDTEAKALVLVGDTLEKRALDAPILMDRFYENTAATDGTDIGSRRKHSEYMRKNNLALASDFTQVWAKARGTRDQIAEGRLPDKTRRDDVGRALHKLYPE